MAYVRTSAAPLGVVRTDTPEERDALVAEMLATPGTTQHYVGSREIEVGDTSVRVLPGVLTVNWYGVAMLGAVIVGGIAVYKLVFTESGKRRINEMMRRWALES
jgi:hypothetical protein